MCFIMLYSITEKSAQSALTMSRKIFKLYELQQGCSVEETNINLILVLWILTPRDSPWALEVSSLDEVLSSDICSVK